MYLYGKRSVGNERCAGKKSTYELFHTDLVFSLILVYWRHREISVLIRQ